MAPKDPQEHITTHYLPATPGWVNSFMSRHWDELRKTKSATQEAQPLEVLRRFLDKTVQCINEFANDLPTDFIFNLGEVGISEWEGRTLKSLIVPKSMNRQKIYQKIKRNLKHVSAIACISAAGESLAPYFITFQGSLLVRGNLKK
jgi:hypothetical protein